MHSHGLGFPPPQEEDLSYDPMTGLLRREGETENSTRGCFKLEEGVGRGERGEVLVMTGTFMELLRSPQEWRIGYQYGVGGW